MFIQHHGALQQRKEIASAPAATLSALPTSFTIDRQGLTCSSESPNQTITVTASAGNSWSASVFSGTSWVMINGTINGTASGTGNGDFTMDAPKYLTGDPREGSVRINSSAPVVYISITQSDCE